MDYNDFPDNSNDLDSSVSKGEIGSYGVPTNEELDRINQIAREKLTANDVYCLDMIPSNTLVDGYFTHMDPGTTLQNYARDAQSGVSIMNSHARSELPIGRTFHGEFVTGPFTSPRGMKILASPETPVVFANAFLPRNMSTSLSADNDSIIRSIATGVVQDTSVGFGGNDYWFRCDRCNRSMFDYQAMMKYWAADDETRTDMDEPCFHMPGQKVYTDADDSSKFTRVTATVMDAHLLEISPVWKGANPSSPILSKATQLVRAGKMSYDELRELDRAMNLPLTRSVQRRLGYDPQVFSLPHNIGDRYGTGVVPLSGSSPLVLTPGQSIYTIPDHNIVVSGFTPTTPTTSTEMLVLDPTVSTAPTIVRTFINDPNLTAAQSIDMNQLGSSTTNPTDSTPITTESPDVTESVEDDGIPEWLLPADNSRASEADKTAQESRAKKYGIGIKEGGHVTKPGKWSKVPDSEWADPVNYRYPVHDKVHADAAARYWAQPKNKKQYSPGEQSTISSRIKRAQAKFGETDDGKTKKVNSKIEDRNIEMDPKDDTGDLEEGLDALRAQEAEVEASRAKKSDDDGGDSGVGPRPADKKKGRAKKSDEDDGEDDGEDGEDGEDGDEKPKKKSRTKVLTPKPGTEKAAKKDDDPDDDGDAEEDDDEDGDSKTKKAAKKGDGDGDEDGEDLDGDGDGKKPKGLKGRAKKTDDEDDGEEDDGEEDGDGKKTKKAAKKPSDGVIYTKKSARDDNSESSEGVLLTDEEKAILSQVREMKVVTVSDFNTIVSSARAAEKDKAFSEAIRAAGYTTVDDVLADAMDGRNYRSDLIKMIHAQGVRAFGEDYDEERRNKMLKHLNTSELRAELASLKKSVEARFRKDIPDTDEDPLRGKLKDRVGGRQTVPYNPVATREENKELADNNSSARTESTSQFKTPGFRSMS
jgi:hypothetical protein